MSATLKLGAGNWATKESSLLGYNSENGNYKPLPFTFSRASNATVVNKDGLIETVGSGEPRIDFKDNTKGVLLLEPSRSNVLPYSNKFLNTGWQYYRGTITANATISPDGTLNASRYQEDSQTGSHLFRRQSLSITNELSYTGSIFAKKGELSSIILQSNSSSRWVASATFNLENGTVTSGTGVIENYGNGWYRCSISGDAVQTTSDAGFEIYTSVGAGRDGDGLFMYGAMFEQGSYATSYIPTSGSAVTRVADVCSQIVPSGIIGQTEGTVFVEIDFANTSGVTGAWSISNGSSANRITMNTTNLSSTQFTLSVAQNYNSGSTKLASANVSFSDKHKVAIKYSGTTLKLFVDGQLADSVSTDGFGNYTNFYVGGNQVGVGGDARKFIQADLYNTALTDQELIALTS